MCKWSKWGDTRIDPCMKDFINNINLIKKEHFKIRACCCGHGKYPMSIVVENEGVFWDLVSGESIFRKKKFYKKDKQGVYYIPEVFAKSQGGKGE